jgi:hypothetical protein
MQRSEVLTCGSICHISGIPTTLTFGLFPVRVGLTVDIGPGRSPYAGSTTSPEPGKLAPNALDGGEGRLEEVSSLRLQAANPAGARSKAPSASELAAVALLVITQARIVATFRPLPFFTGERLRVSQPSVA